MGTIAQSIFPDQLCIENDIATTGSTSFLLAVDNPAVRLLSVGAVSFDMTPYQFTTSRTIFAMTSQHNSGSNSYFIMGFSSAGPANVRLNILSRLGLTGSSTVLLASPTGGLVLNQKIRILLASDGSIYIDGAVPGYLTGSLAAGWFAAMTATTWKMTLMGYRTGSSSGQGLNGKMNNVRFWDKVPTAGEALLDATTGDWTQEQFADSIVTCYPFEGDTNDLVGTDHATPTLTPSYVIP